jgi:hypothetical protein
MHRVRQVLGEVVSASGRREFPGSLRGIHRMLGDLECGGHDSTVRAAWWQAMWGVGPGGTGVRRNTEGISDVDNQVSVTRGELAHRQMGPEGDNHG